MSHSREKLHISKAEHVFWYLGKDLSVLAMLTSAALKEEKRDKYIKNGCWEENLREVEKGFYLSFVAFMECWLLAGRDKSLL